MKTYFFVIKLKSFFKKSPSKIEVKNLQTNSKLTFNIKVNHLNFKYMEFTNKFDFIKGKRIDLIIQSKDGGNDKIIPFYYFSIVLHDTVCEVGKISLRIGHNHHSFFNGNIGYEVYEGYRGHNYAFEAIKTIVPLAIFHDMDYLILTCAADNIPSKKTIEKTGAVFLKSVTPPSDYVFYFKDIPPYCIYRLNIKKEEL
ncbi:MAG TPA: GNAT family N-acetyltransferase [Bacilli bacterium]|nr:GNAT family N-acetyltransferase [Bacilli bacterium]